jgi:hypothetical protein
MASNLGHPTRFADYAAAAWFAASMAVVVGAIGSGLESDEEVHETISRYRPDPPGRTPVGAHRFSFRRRAALLLLPQSTSAVEPSKRVGPASRRCRR